MSNYLVDGADLTSIANAIRTKGGTSAQLAFPAGFVSSIGAIPTGGGGLEYDTGTFTLATDVTFTTVPHGLGKVPKFVAVWQSSYDDNTLPQQQVNLGYVYLERIMELPQRLTSAAASNNGFFAEFHWANNAVSAAFSGPNSTSYMLDPAELTASAIPLDYRGTQAFWRAGVTYHYFVSEGWWT